MNYYKIVAIARDTRVPMTEPTEIWIIGYQHPKPLNNEQLQKRAREDFSKRPEFIFHEIKPAVEISEEDYKQGLADSIIFQDY